MSNALFKTPSTFTADLLHVNKISEYGFKTWLIEPGMGFRDSNKWWGKFGKRPSPHEGVDLRKYNDHQGKTRTLKPGSLIPVIWSGQVKKVMDDLVAKTVIISHKIPDSFGKNLHTFYSHINPGKTIQIGAMLSSGAIVGQIAAPQRFSKCPSHLHLSAAWIGTNISDNDLCWEEFSTNENIIPVDPSTFITP